MTQAAWQIGYALRKLCREQHSQASFGLLVETVAKAMPNGAMASSVRVGAGASEAVARPIANAGAVA